MKECDYIIYVDRTKTIVFVGQLYEVFKFDSLDSIKTDISQIITDEECTMEFLEILGIGESEYLE